IPRHGTAEILALDDREVAIIQRGGTNSHQHLSGPGRRFRSFGEPEPVERRAALNDLEYFHRLPPKKRPAAGLGNSWPLRAAPDGSEFGAAGSAPRQPRARNRRISAAISCSAPSRWR